MKIHVTEHKSSGRPIVAGHTVRVFVDNDYHYGYFVDEALLYSLLSIEQQNAYISKPGEIKLDVVPEIAQKLIDAGVTPFTKRQVV